MKFETILPIRLLRVLLPLLVIFCCSFIPKKENIQLIDATYENWTSGINGGGSGKEYYIKIKILTENKIVFDALWVNNKSFKTYLANNRKYVSSAPITFTKNDTITVRVSENSSQTNIPKVKAPIRYKGDALLRYFINNKPYYLTIQKLQQIDSPNRP